MINIMKRLTVCIASATLLVFSCSQTTTPDRRFPFDNESEWDFNLPPSVFWRSTVSTLVDNDNLQTAFGLLDSDDEPVEFVLDIQNTGIALCVPGGLNPGETYTWIFEPTNPYLHQLLVPDHADQGIWTFTTGARSEYESPGRDCAAVRRTFKRWYDLDSGYLPQEEPEDTGIPE